MTNREKYAKEILDIACAGEPVAVKNGVPCMCGAISCDECDLNNDAGCNNNLVRWCNSEYGEPTVDWSKVPIDTPILVKDMYKDEWKKRHFAGYKNGKVYAYHNGFTSWTENSVTCCWEHAKLATDDELDENSILRADGRKEE